MDVEEWKAGLTSVDVQGMLSEVMKRLCACFEHLESNEIRECLNTLKTGVEKSLLVKPDEDLKHRNNRIFWILTELKIISKCWERSTKQLVNNVKGKIENLTRELEMDALIENSKRKVTKRLPENSSLTGNSFLTGNSSLAENSFLTENDMDYIRDLTHLLSEQSSETEIIIDQVLTFKPANKTLIDPIFFSWTDGNSSGSVNSEILSYCEGIRASECVSPSSNITDLSLFQVDFM